MNGTFVNGLAIMAGALIGIALKTGFFKDKSEQIMGALGLAVMIIGLQGVIGYSDILVLIVSLAIGVLIGETLQIEAKLDRFGQKMEERFSRNQDGRFAQGLVSATLLFGVGAMAIVGSLESGLNYNETILYTKSLLDFVAAIVFSSTFGWGVFFSAFLIVFYQGSITLFSVLISSFLNETLIGDMSAVGSVLILALGLNMVKATRFKVANLLPSLVVAIVLRLILQVI